jgi:hypothetical protein
MPRKCRRLLWKVEDEINRELAEGSDEYNGAMLVIERMTELLDETDARSSGGDSGAD